MSVNLSDCPACASARADKTSGLIRIGCSGCKARTLAHSPQYFASRQAGKLLPEYVAALARAYPGVEPAAAHAMVQEWMA
jgi:hypothetical protein